MMEKGAGYSIYETKVLKNARDAKCIKGRGEFEERRTRRESAGLNHIRKKITAVAATAFI